VPDVLLSGDHGAIKDWRQKQSLISTLKKRPDLISWEKLNKEEKAILREFMDESRS
jgi:tRNA (guanine37-N1)-methyltransferase